MDMSALFLTFCSWFSTKVCWKCINFVHHFAFHFFPLPFSFVFIYLLFFGWLILSSFTSFLECKVHQSLHVFVFICMNTCWAPHLEMSHKHLTVATMVLFSFSKQTYVCMCVLEYPPNWLQISSVVDMAGPTWNCCCLSAYSLYTRQACTRLQCHFIWSHTHSVCMVV